MNTHALAASLSDLCMYLESLNLFFQETLDVMGHISNKKLGMRRPPSSFVLFYQWRSACGVKLPVKKRLWKKTPLLGMEAATLAWESMSPKSRTSWVEEAQRRGQENLRRRTALLGNGEHVGQEKKAEAVVPLEPVDEGLRSWRFCGSGFELSLEQKLGGGTYGAVYTATDRSGRPWALKVARSDQYLEELAKESRILMKLRHPSVVMAWGLLAGPSAMVGMPMERADIDLGSALRRYPSICAPFTMMKRLQAAHQVLQGIAYIHEMGVHSSGSQAWEPLAVSAF